MSVSGLYPKAPKPSWIWNDSHGAGTSLDVDEMEHLDESRRTQKRQVISAEDLPEVCCPCLSCKPPDDSKGRITHTHIAMSHTQEPGQFALALTGLVQCSQATAGCCFLERRA